MTLTINTPPSVAIVAPADGSVFNVGDLVTFQGTADDLEDGDLASSLSWTSDLDGFLGSGASLPTPSLTVGQHTITASVTDSHGAGDSAAISVRIRPLPVTVTFLSTSIEDGSLRESNENSNVGGVARNLAPSNQENRALRFGDSNQDKQYKSLLSFDTASIPDGAEIQEVTLSLVRGRLVGGNPFDTHGNLVVDVKSGHFGSTSALVASDFEAAAMATASAILSRADTDFATSMGSLDTAGRAAINPAGLTQMRVYFEIDDDDDRSRDYVGYFSGDTQDTSLVPKITVTYQE